MTKEQHKEAKMMCDMAEFGINNFIKTVQGVAPKDLLSEEMGAKFKAYVGALREFKELVDSTNPKEE